VRGFEDYATGHYTKEELLKRARTWGLTNRRGKPLTSQAIGMLLRNQLYACIADVPEYGVGNKRGHFEPLISEKCSIAFRRSCPGEWQGRRRGQQRIPISRCAASFAASPAHVA
jgi:hypothetical protein